MVLNEYQIMKRLVNNELIIKPIISVNQFNPASVDLRLGSEFKIMKSTRFALIEPSEQEEEIKRKLFDYTEDINILLPDRFILHPYEFALATTLEYVRLPSNLKGVLEGRSTSGRVSLMVHSTAGFVDPGYCGTLTFELLNVGKVPFPMYPGVRIAQISFDEMEETTIPYRGKYFGELGTVSAKIYKDKEYKIIRKIIDEQTLSKSKEEIFLLENILNKNIDKFSEKEKRELIEIVRNIKSNIS